MAFTKVTGTLVDIGDLDLTNVGQIQLDSIAGDADSNTSITFSGSDVITIATGGAGRLTIGDGALSPVTDNQIDLGTSSLEFKDAFFDGTVTADAFAGPITGDLTGTLQTAAQPTVTSLGTLTGLTGGTGDLVWDSPTFAVDSSENRVGIGTASPLGLLHIDSSAKTEILLEGTQTSNGEIVDISFRNASDSVAAIQVLRVSNNDQADMAFFTQPNSGSVTERMRIDSNGDIAIGSANVRRDLASSTSPVLSLEGTFPAINLRDSGTGYGGFLGLDGNIVYLGGHTGTAAMQCYVNGSEKMRINAEGIAFNGDSAAANSLDDYEEGAWTPNLNGATTSIQDAHYVKIGSFVYLNCYFTFSSLPNDSQVLQISGLPYATQGGATYGGGSISYAHTANVADMTPLTASGNSYIYFHELDGTSAAVTRATATSRFGSAGYILLNMHYMTAF